MRFPLAFLLALSISISTPTGGAETGTTAPAGATVLFDGSDSSKWEAKGGNPVTWPVREGYLEVGQGDIQTKERS